MCVIPDAPLAEAGPPRPKAIAVDPVELATVDEVQVTVLVDNAVDYLLGDAGPVKRMSIGRFPLVKAPQFESGTTASPLVSEHGFSALIAIRSGNETHVLLYDTGLSPNGMAQNIETLGIQAGTIEAVVVSHGHYDHTGGLCGLASLRNCKDLPLLLHPSAWARRRAVRAGREPWELPVLSKSWIESQGFALMERREPTPMFSNTALLTGQVDRTTEFETGMRGHEAFQNGAWVPDPWILDDQAFVVNVRGKGLVVVTGCGHSGVVNIVRFAQRLTGERRLHALIGGFHLQGPGFDEIVDPTIEALTALAPDAIVPSHCSGRKARHRLAATLPDAFITNSVGSTYAFSG